MTWTRTRCGALTALTTFAVAAGLLVVEPAAGPAQTAKTAAKKKSKKAVHQPFKHGRRFSITFERDVNQPAYSNVTGARCTFRSATGATSSWTYVSREMANNNKRVTLIFEARRALAATSPTAPATQKKPAQVPVGSVLIGGDVGTIDVTVIDNNVEDELITGIPVIETELDPCL